MSVRIRLTRTGKRSNPKYRIIVSDKRNKRDGKAIEILGNYDPVIDPAKLVVKKDRLEYWMGKGASLSDSLKSLLHL
ncbi:30S ribosomal protein S16 [Candidatus Gottesmanbacteria bacterium RIFCSPHIGHO2_01_FULL_39_10]|uniref:Small ribosomal subunit protein bS16 n=1 Tax=Candidatus Gottesmanbacteria bacterium RIFCSPHIGHO2_01_FULL_39_10 TaxID=1798375 RepID=A0A1F5ZME6_9BACT|nr:MAG: 30S ribosomal protein S16 [Candidatus Gottesmanbacteria bacterium RIFCSPHIGHO2_01_FULL_39_10]